MANITIRFISSYDLVSKLIDWTTNSLWCHVEVLNRTSNGYIGAHAITGVQDRKLDWVKTERERRYAIPVTDEQYNKAMEWLESRLGQKYSYKDILGLALHLRIGYSEHEMICSAFVMQMFMNIGIYPLNCLEGFAYLITPETLHLSPILMGRCIYGKPFLKGTA